MSARLLLPALLACTLAASPTAALTVLPATFEELVRESTAVVYGRVVSVRGTWTPDRRTIETVITLEALEHFKGTETDTTTFTVPGGTAGGRILVMPGAPTFRPGDAVVVFLRGAAPALPSPVGLSLGVYRVAASPRDGTLMVVPTPITPAEGEGPVRRGSRERAPRSLSRFGADVRALGAAR